MVISTNDRIAVTTRSSFAIGKDGELYHLVVKYKLQKEHILSLAKEHEILIELFEHLATGEDLIVGDNSTFKFDDNSVWVRGVTKNKKR
ncbi:MAG: hypothetical protein N4A71_08140 [Carboxylicivirga sp.]|jgi:hypothetical protein|nr:hypothetical protein [Carboxylicivirga sp.]